MPYLGTSRTVFPTRVPLPVVTTILARFTPPRRSALAPRPSRQPERRPPAAGRPGRRHGEQAALLDPRALHCGDRDELAVPEQVVAHRTGSATVALALVSVTRSAEDRSDALTAGGTRIASGPAFRPSPASRPDPVQGPASRSTPGWASAPGWASPRPAGRPGPGSGPEGPPGGCSTGPVRRSAGRRSAADPSRAPDRAPGRACAPRRRRSWSTGYAPRPRTPACACCRRCRCRRCRSREPLREVAVGARGAATSARSIIAPRSAASSAGPHRVADAGGRRTAAGDAIAVPGTLDLVGIGFVANVPAESVGDEPRLPGPEPAPGTRTGRSESDPWSCGAGRTAAPGCAAQRLRDAT